MLHLAVESAFDHLLATWRAHDANQSRNDLPLRELVASRHELDKARERIHRLRTAIYPDAEEVQSVVQSVWCESLETVVHLRWIDRHPTRPGNFRCTCGHLVPVDWGALPAPNANP